MSEKGTDDSSNTIDYQVSFKLINSAKTIFNIYNQTESFIHYSIL